MSTPKRIFVKGNEAISRGALAAGMKCFFGYPITPQNDIPEFLSSALVEAGPTSMPYPPDSLAALTTMVSRLSST